jgi:hypothetical protein
MVATLRNLIFWISFPGAVLTLLLWVTLMLAQGKRRNAVALVGMIVFGIGFIGFAIVYAVTA